MVCGHLFLVKPMPHLGGCGRAPIYSMAAVSVRCPAAHAVPVVVAIARDQAVAPASSSAGSGVSKQSS